MRLSLTGILLTAVVSCFAQKKYTLSGSITDQATGEQLIGATVKILELPSVYTAANNYGYYVLLVPEGSYTVIITYVGFQTETLKVCLKEDQHLNISMTPGTEMKEVVVHAANADVGSPQMGLEKISMAQINAIPVMMGEKDILKTITLLPGIKSSGESNTGFYVRGGGSDQNLILLDEATVYNASHLYGFFSIFNTDAIKEISVLKGGIPAEYGGRLSSVVNVSMQEGNNQNFGVQGGIGLISSRLKLEGPLQKGKGSFMLSARRTYFDLFLKASADSSIRGSSLYFYDLNGKANYHFNDKNAVYISGYLGKDVLGLKDNFGTNWGNTTGTLRFNHLFSSRLFANTSLIYSNYKYTIESLSAASDFKATTKITDLNFKEDVQFTFDDAHTFKFGLNVLHHAITPGNISVSLSSVTTIEKRYGYESALYASDSWRPTSKLNLLYGLRLSSMLLRGPGTFKTYDAEGNSLTSDTYSSGANVKSYLNLEPRFSASYLLSTGSSLKLSYHRNTQNIHLLSNTNGGTPTDIYVMSSTNIKPEINDEISAGYFRSFRENNYEFSAELYYKQLQNQIDYKNGAELIANQDVESQLLYGSGRAYGLELFLKKKYGRFNGWLGYTLSKTERKFNEINDGNYFPASYDRRHDFSIAGIYKFNKSWTFSATFLYGTGNAVTYPTGKYNVGGLTTFSYSARNGYRMPATHRLDIGATLEGKAHRKYHSSWTFGVYNVYGNDNPYAITFRDSETLPNTTEAVQTSIFPDPMPSVTWNFKF